MAATAQREEDTIVVLAASRLGQGEFYQEDVVRPLLSRNVSLSTGWPAEAPATAQAALGPVLGP